jgi:hypothetical protein
MKFLNNEGLLFEHCALAILFKTQLVASDQSECLDHILNADLSRIPRSLVATESSQTMYKAILNPRKYDKIVHRLQTKVLYVRGITSSKYKFAHEHGNLWAEQHVFNCMG